MTLWVLIRSFVIRFRLSLFHCWGALYSYIPLYCCIFQTPSMSSLSLTSTFLILNSPQSECLLWFHCKFFDYIIMNLLSTQTPQGVLASKLRQHQRVPGSVSPSSIFKFSPCSASYSLFFFLLGFVFPGYSLFVPTGALVLFFTMLFSAEIMPRIIPLLLHKWKVLKNLQVRRALGCLLFQSSPGYSRIQTSVEYCFWVHFIQMRTLKVTGVSHVVVTHLHQELLVSHLLFKARWIWSDTCMCVIQGHFSSVNVHAHSWRTLYSEDSDSMALKQSLRFTFLTSSQVLQRLEVREPTLCHNKVIQF